MTEHDHLARLRELAEKLNNTEYQLAHTNALLAAIVENAAEAILGKDLEGHITAWNPAATKLYGWKPEEAIGQHVFMLIPEDKRKEFSLILDKVHNGEPVEMHRTERLHRSGKRLDLMLTISPIRGRDGHILGASSLAHPASWI